MKKMKNKKHQRHRKAEQYENQPEQCVSVKRRSLVLQRKGPQGEGGEAAPTSQKKSVAANGVRRRRFFPPLLSTPFVTHSHHRLLPPLVSPVLFFREEL